MFTYKIIKSAGEETPKGNVAFEQPEKLGMSISKTAGNPLAVLLFHLL